MGVSDLEQWSTCAHDTHHIDAARDALSVYEALEAAGDDSLAAYLVRSIIAGETRHHQVAHRSMYCTRHRPRRSKCLAARPSRRPRSERPECSLHHRATTRHRKRRPPRNWRSAHRLGEVADTQRRIPPAEMMELDTKRHIKVSSFILDLT